MAKYVFTLDHPLLPGVTEELSDDLAAKKYACIVADEINRNAKCHARKARHSFG